jgi:hypothetical protein
MVYQLERIEQWEWADEPRTARFEQLLKRAAPFNGVVQRGQICSTCGREVELLFLDPNIDSETEMTEKAVRLIEEARRRVEKDALNRCGQHNLTWAAMP